MDYPLLFAPVYKDYIWGGDRIPTEFGRDVPAGRYAESWEVSDRPEGMSVVVNGALAGKTLHELVAEYGSRLTGSRGVSARFPLLIKIIDSRQALSVQVHPSDSDTEAVGGEAKTEMWYVLKAETDARVFAGLKRGTGKQEFESALEAGRIEHLLNSVSVQEGDAIFIPGGRIHAIDAGCLLLEIQQNSNTTYRVFDWGRLGDDGKPRELHLREAMAVIDWDDAGVPLAGPSERTGVDGGTLEEILACRHFKVERLQIRGSMRVANDGGSFHAYFTSSGEVTVDTGVTAAAVGYGVSCLVPASVSEYTVTSEHGDSEIIRASVP